MNQVVPNSTLIERRVAKYDGQTIWIGKLLACWSVSDNVQDIYVTRMVYIYIYIYLIPEYKMTYMYSIYLPFSLSYIHY
jgi:hypothetical protein